MSEERAAETGARKAVVGDGLASLMMERRHNFENGQGSGYRSREPGECYALSLAV